MSDYEKPVKECQDAPVGIRAVNQLSENQDATKALLEAEHLAQPDLPPFAPGFGDLSGGGTQFGQGIGLDFVSGGRHNTPKVARGIMRVEVDDLFAVGSNVLRTAFHSGVCVSLARIGVGSYFVPIEGLTDFDAEAWPLHGDSTVTRIVQQTPVGASTSASATPGIYVSLWQETLLEPNVNTADLGFALTDFGFQLVVYGYNDTAVPATSNAGAMLRRSTRPRGPMQFWPGRGR